MKLFIITVILLALCVAGMGIRIWIKGEFTERDIERNKNMKKLGIRCVKLEESEQHHNGDYVDRCSACTLSASCGDIIKNKRR
jgi:hypothetical protein